MKKACALVIAALALGACAQSVPEPSKRVVLAQVLATSAQLVVEREGGVKRSGSGVVLATGLPVEGTAILTTAHLLEPQVEQTAYVIAGVKKEPIAADVVAIDSTRDLALLTAPVTGVSRVALADRAELADEIFIVAYPWGRARTVVNGAVSQIATQASIEDPLSISGPVGLVDATVSYGMSGGGVFDRRSGQLVGLVRGYRTAHLSLSSQDSPLKLPIAGETTVISTLDVVCFLRSAGYQRLIENSAVAAIPERDCQ